MHEIHSTASRAANSGKGIFSRERVSESTRSYSHSLLAAGKQKWASLFLSSPSPSSLSSSRSAPTAARSTGTLSLIGVLTEHDVP
ncbi:hypothetical protein BT93_B2519 [Corymbia citriodora subsp. variegata]|nr:hypothetical protein BT93_B2519 [Corymbia citriodora subsp. variegata]